jgi:para-nitrobenzyl esterase
MGIKKLAFLGLDTTVPRTPPAGAAMKLIRRFSTALPWPIVIAGLLMIEACGGGSGNTPAQGPMIVTTSLLDGTIGSSYSQAIQGSGGASPFTWSVTAGTLPHNLVLTSSAGNSAMISGTPDRVQSSVAFTIQVTDANGKSGNQSYSVNIKSTPTIVVTGSGAVQGLVEGNFLSFRGIPFAAPPVGDLRWRPPAAPASWDGIRSATTFGNRCPQTNFNNGVQGDEDCLTLNIYMTNPAASSKLPVMVFFHGGGETLGSAQDYPWHLAPPLAGHGVIVVTAQYRLGLLGFLAHPLLTAESGTGSSGNYALMDMIATLQWVHDNIAGFGGDPTRVMMFGQSAGSANVEALLGSPKAAGLFTSAGMESYAFRGNLLGSGVADAYPAYANLTKLVQCDTAADVLACLRAVPASTLVLTELLPNEFGFIGFNLEPVVLPEDPFNKLSQLGSPVPLLIGSNSDEQSQSEVFNPPMDATQYATAIHAQFDPLLAGAGATILSAPYYPAAFDTTPNYSHIDVETDYSFTCEARDLARAVAQVAGAQRPAVWRYLFAHRYENDASLNALRAFHTAELNFVSGNFDLVSYAAVPYTPSAAEVTLSNEILDYWARFAATGDPNDPNGVATRWLAYDAAENILQLGAQGGDTIANLPGGYRNTQCDFLATVPLKF